MLKKILFLTLLTFSISATRAQKVLPDVEKITANFKADDVYYQDNGPDTLIYKDSVYYFNKSPIQQFAGYSKIFNKKEIAMFISPGSKGYRLRWVIKDDILYINNIIVDSEWPREIKSEDGKVKTLYLSKKEIKSRLEKFLGAKFNRRGLLPVKWVEGEYLVRNLNLKDRRSDLVEKQRGIELKCFKFLFEKGGILKSKQEFELKKKNN